ncbi:hypothetical protein, partial [Stenotrophomonas maltophilia]|uniref:hypothetical protein n=1 Tax=Stenotrophomonas maltophilia TaxID=40324 RepID=UPI0019546832
RLGSRIHAADTPAHPTRPSFDRFRWPAPTEKKKKIKSGSRAALARVEPSVGSALQKAPARLLLILIFFFFSVGGKHPESVSGRVGG